MLVHGRIVEEQKNYYLVDTEKGLVRSFLKGVLKKKQKRLYVGDFVTVEIFNFDIPEGIVRELHPRKNILHKPPVANIDRVILIQTLHEPPLDIEFMDRFLFSMQVPGYPVCIVFNKSDILADTDRAAVETLIQYYSRLGYTCLQTSALTGDNIDILIAACRDTLSIFAGPSGTGKTTILSTIFPDHDFRIGELSKVTGRGVHTTTHITLLKLTDGGYIADTPGFSFVQPPQINETEVAAYFPEIAAMQGSCKFNNCIHENEPQCAVREKAESGEILRSRYDTYLKLYHLMKEKRREYRG